MADLIFNIDIKGALAALKKLNKSVDDTGKKADDSFGRAREELGRFVATGEKAGTRLGRGFDKAGISIGAMSGVVGALTQQFIQLGIVAAKAFLDIAEGAITLNKEAELTRLSLIAIFEGNEKAADAFISTVGDLAIRLGVSRQELTGLAKGILPDVGGIQDTAELLENVIVLGRDAGQNIESIRIATEEALSGNLVSLGRRLNIPKKTLDNIREYQKEMDLASAINKGLAERIAETGISADVTADSFATLEGAIRGQFENLQREIGVAPFEELKEQAQAFLDLFEERGPDIIRVAQAFGDLAANVIDFVGTNLISFIDSIDFEGVEDLADGFSNALDAAKLLFDVLFDLGDTDFNDIIADITEITSKLEKAAIAAAQLFSVIRAEQARAQAELEFFKKDLDEAFAAEQGFFEVDPDAPLGFLLAKVSKGFASADKEARAAALGEEAYNESLRNSLQAFDDHSEAQVESEQRTKDRRKEVEDTTAADLAAADAQQKSKKALADLADAQTEAAKAQEEISKKQAEFDEDQQRRLTDIQRKEAQKRFDNEVKNAQRREDIARKNADAIEDIFRKQDQAIADAGKDLSQQEQDIARQGVRDRRDIERNAANERVDIERNFRQELRRIQAQFNQDAADAERNNDAQAFLQAVRSRDEQVQVATESRDVSVEEAQINAERQRDALAISLAAEVEDARIANAQKLEALQTRLNQELEAQAIKVQREFEAETIREQRLKEKRDLALQRQLEDFARTEAEKQAKLQESLATQVALIEAAAAKEIEITAAAEAQKTAIVQAETERRQSLLAVRISRQARGQTGIRRGLQEFAAGGRPPVGQPVKVGERGPEIFLPDTAGTIIPNNAIFSPPAQPPPLTQMSSSSITNNPTFNLAESMFQDPIARRNLTNFVLGVLAEA